MAVPFAQTFEIGHRKIGEGELPLFLPDIGTFFNQDVSLAHQLVEQLLKSGVEAIKGELLHTADIALDVDYEVKYYGETEGFRSERYRELIERKVVALDDYEQIFAYCRQRQVPFVLSVYDLEGTDFAKQIGVSALKVASSNITHLPLIRYLAESKLPLILDTGRANFSEVAQAVEWLKKFGAEQVIIEHSPKAPPAPVNEQNLQFINTLKTSFKAPVGLSDHHAGNEMLYAATLFGACVLEKGLCSDDQALDQDVTHAMSISEVASALQQIKLFHDCIGDGEKEVLQQKHPARMGMNAKYDLQKGQHLTLETVNFAFPAIGIGAEHWEQVESKVLLKDLAAGQPISWRDLQADK